MDYLQLVKEKEEEEDALYKRMDADTDMLYLKKFLLKDTRGREVPDIVNVTLNKPAVFAANVISAVNAVKQQVIVESDDRSVDTTEIEAFQTAAFAGANSRLMRQGEPLLNSFADVQLAVRGRMARRILFRKKGGEIIPDITSWDGRYLRYEMGDNGPEWAAYTTTRTKAEIEAAYPQAVVKGKTGQVIDVWDSLHNEVWVDEKLVSDAPHSYGETPVVIEKVPLGYGAILMDKDRIEHDGESIFFLIRDIVPQLNMLLSILQTLNLKLVKAPMQYANKEGAQAEPPEYDDATSSGSMTAVDLGGGIVPVNYGDARQAAQMAYNMMEKAIQEGGYTDIDIGNVRQPFSAIALITIGESKDQVYLPRLAAKENLNVQTAEMFTRQILQLSGEIKLGAPGHMRTFQAGKIAGEYTTNYRYFIKSPKTDIARMAVAQVAERFYPRKYILSEVLQVEDVNGVEREWNRQQAELLSPNVKRHRVIMALLEEAEKGDENASREAMLMAQEMGVSIELLKKGIMPESQAKGGAGSSQIPLLGQSGQTGALPPSDTEQPALALPQVQ